MNILFICGSAEPGKDGVGDYTRRLAGELIRQGHQVKIISLYDKVVVSIYEGEQEIEGIKIEVLRLPKKLNPTIKFEKAKEYITQFDPYCLSLQYVPFSFQDKGLPFGLTKKLKKIGIGFQWHIMFHELWVGIDKESGMKHSLWGKVQKKIIQRMLIQLKPIKIHTHTRIYQLLISQMGYHSDYLPLFGNIPVQQTTNKSFAKQQELIFIVFGSIQSGAPIEGFTKELSRLGKLHNKSMQFQFIGRCGSELEHWVSVCEKAGFSVKIFGEQSAEKISEVLSNADWGISSTPMAQIEKSGTVAAMREHLIPVCNVSRSWSPTGFNTIIPPDGIIHYRTNDLKLELPLNNINIVSLKEICTYFVSTLNNYENNHFASNL